MLIRRIVLPIRPLLRACHDAVLLQPVDDKPCIPGRPVVISVTKRVFILSVGLFCFPQQTRQGFFRKCFLLHGLTPLSTSLILTEMSTLLILQLYPTMLSWSGVVPLLTSFGNTTLERFSSFAFSLLIRHEVTSDSTRGPPI